MFVFLCLFLILVDSFLLFYWVGWHNSWFGLLCLPKLPFDVADVVFCCHSCRCFIPCPYSKLKNVANVAQHFLSTFFVVSKVFLNFAINHWQYGFSESRWCDIWVKTNSISYLFRESWNLGNFNDCNTMNESADARAIARAWLISMCYRYS